MPQILFIGPTQGAQASSIGGTTISFDILVNQAQDSGCSCSVISVNRTPHSWFNALFVLINALVMIPRHRVVMLNANPLGALLLAPVIAAYTRFCRRKYVFRMFGGDLIEIYEGKPALAKYIMRKSIFSADIIYLQTRRLIEHFSSFSKTIKWLPTTRVLVPRSAPKSFRHRFVYIGQIKQNKGIDLLLEIADSRADITLSLYGPILEPQYDKLRDMDCYYGVLPHREVAHCLSQHDVLLLPTYHPGEGYPGIIIEAFAAGLPVVTTNWLAIPEIVKHQFNGLLIETHSLSELNEAISNINQSNYPQLSTNAAASSSQFDARKVNQRILDELKQIALN